MIVRHGYWKDRYSEALSLKQTYRKETKNLVFLSKCLFFVKIITWFIEFIIESLERYEKLMLIDMIEYKTFQQGELIIKEGD